MEDKKAIQVKLAIVAGLSVLIVILGISYTNTFGSAKKEETIQKRYTEFETLGLGMPSNCTMIDGRLQGGALQYGIDARMITVLDITGISSGDRLNEATESVKEHYARALLDWHPGYLKLGRSGSARTVYGPAGMAMVEVHAFWYGDIVKGSLGKETADIILSKVKPEDGMGHRYALVNIIVCTRP